MKIVGFTHHLEDMLLKSDSSLLPNRKPFFLPEGATDVVAYPAIAMRISRLGRRIAPRFAERYVDSVAFALDIIDQGMARQLMQEHRYPTPAVAMEGAFPIGPFRPIEETDVLPLDAIVEAGRVMTLRPGDIVYVRTDEPAIVLSEGLVVERDGLYCKMV